METWKPVAGWEGHYEVSDLGRVRSLSRVVDERRCGSRKIPGRILKTPARSRKLAYPCACLCISGTTTTRTVHSLVMEAFVGPRPDGMEIRHLNGNPTDPRLSNLAYGTGSENQRDKRRHGTCHESAKTHCPQGHPYAGENLYFNKRSNKRFCRACGKAGNERRYAVRKAATPNPDKVRKMALSISCSYCRAGVGKKCRTGDGHPARRVHYPRWSQAREAVAA